MKRVAEKEIDATRGPLFQKIIKYSLPIMATGILQILYNASDMIVVGKFSSHHAMGAVGACGALINLIINLFLGLSVGVGVCVAHDIGAKKYEDVKQVIHTSLVASIYCGIFLAIFGYIFSGYFLTIMGTPAELYDEAVPYMKAYFVGMPGCVIFNFCAAALRSAGDSKRPLVILTISGFANVVLNFVMVYFFKMGAVGVGIATTVAQYLSAILIVIYMINMDGYCKIILKEIKVHKDKLIRIIKIGIPAGIQGTVFSLSNVVIQSNINAYGPIVVDGNSAASSIEGLIYICMNSFYHAALTFSGQNLGAGEYKRIKKTAFLCLGMVAVLGLVIGNVLNIFSEQLLLIYQNGSMDVVHAGAQRMQIVSTTFVLCGLMEVLSGTLRGLGKSVTSMYIAILGSCVFRIVWCKYICDMFPGDIRVLYLSYPTSWLVTTLALGIACILAYRKMLKNHQKNVEKRAGI